LGDALKAFYFELIERYCPSMKAITDAIESGITQLKQKQVYGNAKI